MSLCRLFFHCLSTSCLMKRKEGNNLLCLIPANLWLSSSYVHVLRSFLFCITYTRTLYLLHINIIGEIQTKIEVCMQPCQTFFLYVQSSRTVLFIIILVVYCRYTYSLRPGANLAMENIMHVKLICKYGILLSHSDYLNFAIGCTIIFWSLREKYFFFIWVCIYLCEIYQVSLIWFHCLYT